jgi:hypothetical protein
VVAHSTAINTKQESPFRSGAYRVSSFIFFPFELESLNCDIVTETNDVSVRVRSKLNLLHPCGFLHHTSVAVLTEFDRDNGESVPTVFLGSSSVLEGGIAERTAREAQLLLTFSSRPAIRHSLLQRFGAGTLRRFDFNPSV